MKKEKKNKRNAKSNIALKIVIMVIGLALVTLSYIFTDKIFGETSVFNSAISSNTFVNNLWQSIPKVVMSVRTIFICWAISFIVTAIISKIPAIGSRKNITIIRLLGSFFKWIVALVAFFLVLGIWGVNTTTLLASAGILTLVVGLGAQSLISDIIAGIFIVFEGEFSIGDIVVIDSWRGTVEEIGMRTTKVVDIGGNVKIINNSEIRSIINQTQKLSLAKCVVSIGYGESLPKVELLIRDNIENIKNAIPAIKEGPFYKGVSELGASSVDLLIVAKCEEEEIYQVQRDLNRELKILFDNNNVEIPFPQIVVNQPSPKSSKSTSKQINEAKKFKEQQEKLTKKLQVDKADSGDSDN